MQLASYLNYYVNDYPIFEVNTNTPMGNGLFQKKNPNRGAVDMNYLKEALEFLYFSFYPWKFQRKERYNSAKVAV